MTNEGMPRPTPDTLMQRTQQMEADGLMGDAAQRAQHMMQLEGMSNHMDTVIAGKRAAHSQEMGKYDPILLDEELNPTVNTASGSLGHRRAQKKHAKQIANFKEARDNVDQEHKDLALEEAAVIHPEAFKKPPTDVGQIAA